MKLFKNVFSANGFLLLMVASHASANIVTPATLTLTAYELWASTSTNCSNPVKVIDNGTAGKSVDIASSTDFGSAKLPPDGTYECLIAVVNDTYTIIPAVTGTSNGTNDLCTAGTTYTQETCHAGTSVNLPDGTTTNCGTGQVDKIAAYISTTGTVGADGGSPATAKKLNSSITVAGGSVDVTLFVTNPDGLVNQSGSCGQNSNAVLGVR
jgi:hypothetical protein